MYKEIKTVQAVSLLAALLAMHQLFSIHEKDSAQAQNVLISFFDEFNRVIYEYAMSCRITVMNSSASQEHDMYIPPIQQ